MQEESYSRQQEDSYSRQGRKEVQKAGKKLAGKNQKKKVIDTVGVMFVDQTVVGELAKQLQKAKNENSRDGCVQSEGSRVKWHTTV